MIESNYKRQTIIPIVLRPMVKEDRPLVLSKWLNGYYRGAVAPFKWCSHSTFYMLYQPTVEALLRASYVRVAVAPEDDSLICGFAVVQDNMVHWCSTQERYRGHGIMRDLLQDLVDESMVYTHETMHWRRKWAPHLPKWKYRPEAVEEVVRKDQKAMRIA